MEWADIAIEGTGLVECLLSAALSSIGFHVIVFEADANPGGDGQSLTVQQIEKKESFQECDVLVDNLATEHGGIRRCSLIDTRPSLFLMGDALAELLIASGADIYLRFADFDTGPRYSGPCCDALSLPISRGEVFRNDNLTLMEKRELMQFLTSFQNCQSPAFHSNQEFEKSVFLPRVRNVFGSRAVLTHKRCWSENPTLEQVKKLLVENNVKTPKLLDLLSHTLFLASLQGPEITTPDDPSWLESPKAATLLNALLVSAAQRNWDLSALESGIRKGAFLLPTDGSTEVHGAILRISALYGGIQMMRAPLLSVAKVKKEHVKGPDAAALPSCSVSIDQTDHLESFLPKVVNSINSGISGFSLKLGNGVDVLTHSVITRHCWKGQSPETFGDPVCAVAALSIDGLLNVKNSTLRVIDSHAEEPCLVLLQVAAKGCHNPHHVTYFLHNGNCPNRTCCTLLVEQIDKQFHALGESELIKHPQVLYAVAWQVAQYPRADSPPLVDQNIDRDLVLEIPTVKYDSLLYGYSAGATAFEILAKLTKCLASDDESPTATFFPRTSAIRAMRKDSPCPDEQSKLIDELSVWASS